MHISVLISGTKSMMRVPIAHGKHGKEQRKKDFVFPTSLFFLCCRFITLAKDSGSLGFLLEVLG